MKNQVFNINRFLNYSTFNIRMNSRSYSMQLLSIALVIFGMLMFSMYNANFFAMEGWMSVFAISGGVAVLIIVAGAFPYLKKKETQLQFYMQPASIAEKFTFEFLLRFVGLFIIFPLLFWSVSELSYFLMSGVRAMRGLSMEGFHRVQFLYESLTAGDESVIIFKLSVSVLLLVMAFIFSGTCTFIKHALIKVAAFVMAIVALVFYYFYTIMERFDFRAVSFSEHEVLRVLSVLVPVFGLVILAFGYSRLKEKEV